MEVSKRLEHDSCMSSLWSADSPLAIKDMLIASQSMHFVPYQDRIFFFNTILEGEAKRSLPEV